MRSVLGADNSLLPGQVEVMELAGGQADVEPIGHPCLVEHLAGGAEVVQVVPLVLNSLQYPNLLGRVVTVVDRDWPIWAGLLIRADLTLHPVVRHLDRAVGGRGEDQQGPGLQQTEGLATRSKHETQ